jgi:hypothetical protein
MTEPDRSPPGDELTQRYREASAQDTRRPGAHVRDAVRAHAQMVIAAGKASTATDNAQHQGPRGKPVALEDLRAGRPGAGRFDGSAGLAIRPWHR